MAEPFLAEIKMFGGNFPPRGYAYCDGQILPINQNQALFSLLGTTYGGDGRTTFALPDLRGRMPQHAGNGAGLSGVSIGQRHGEETHTLAASEMTAHVHELRAEEGAASTASPGSTVVLASTAGRTTAYSPATNLVAMAAPLANAGGGQPHENRQPYLAISFIIALQGIFPSRN